MQVAVKALSVNVDAIYKRLENKTNSSVISMHFVLIHLFTGFSLKNRSLLKNLPGVRHFTKAQILSLTDTGTYISRNTNRPEYDYILWYYILRCICVLHFASKVITFCVTDVIRFCFESYYILRYYCILWQELLHFASLLHFV